MLTQRFDGDSRMLGEFCRPAWNPSLSRCLRGQRAGSPGSRAKTNPRNRNDRRDGVEDLTVDIRTTTSHKVPFFKLKTWLESSGRDPREAALKTKLR